jgi:hypothetical protein
MQETPIDYRAAEAVLMASRTSVIPAGAWLDKEFFDWCRQSEFGLVEIMSLFPKKGHAGIRYPCDVRCPTCERWRVQEYAKETIQKLISAVKSTEPNREPWRFECAACNEARERERERAYESGRSHQAFEALREEEREKARKNTPRFVEKFLNLANQWPAEMTQAHRFLAITHEPADFDLLSVAIRNMPQDAFERTPYWKAVADEAVQRAGGKCSICAGGGLLALHQRTPQKLGQQHTEEGLREILCLCERCRNTHILKSPPPQS